MRAIAIVLLSSGVASADGALDATAHLGTTRAPFEDPALSEARGHGVVLVVEGSHALAPRYEATVRLPAVLASVAQPSGAYADRVVSGNPQLRIARRMDAGARVALELGLPLAGHASDRLPDRALAIADGIEGRAAPELFTPGVVPATFAGELSFGARGWRFELSARLAMMLRISEANMASSTTNAAGLATVVSAQVRRRLTPRLAATLAMRVFADVAPVIEHARGRLQDLEHVGLAIRAGRRTELTVGLQAAIGGELGGSTFGGGVHVSTR